MFGFCQNNRYSFDLIQNMDTNTSKQTNTHTKTDISAQKHLNVSQIKKHLKLPCGQGFWKKYQKELLKTGLNNVISNPGCAVPYGGVYIYLSDYILRDIEEVKEQCHSKHFIKLTTLALHKFNEMLTVFTLIFFIFSPYNTSLQTTQRRSKKSR